MKTSLPLVASFSGREMSPPKAPPRPCSSSAAAPGIFKRLAASPEKHLLDGIQIGQSKCF